jgi:hypothetical protein
MGRGRPSLVLIIGLAAAVTLALAATKAPETGVVIESKTVFKKLTKSPVAFYHAKHKEFACTACHHAYNHGKNVWQEGQEVKKCGECHEEKKQDKILGLKDAFHKQCMDCHKKMAKERGKDKSGPTACNKCHPPKPGEKPEKEEDK